MALLAVVATAAALRLFALHAQPGGLYPDEAAEGYDAHRVLHLAGYHPVFFADDAGREALYGYLVALAFRLAGESVTVLRATSAVLGVLAVIAVYGWLRHEGRAVALGAAGWVAGSLWLICISRDGMRNILVPVTGALALWAMTEWARRPSRNRALLAGAAMALGLWTYQPLKLLPLLLVAWLAWLRHHDAERWRALKRGLPALAIAYVLVGSPMLFTAVTQPGLYFGRAVGVSAAGQHTGLAALATHTLRTLAMFALTGDPNERHNVGGMPLLGWPLTLLAGLGAWRAWRRRRDDPLASLVLLAVPVFLIPPLVATADAAPHFLRSLGLAAPLAGLVGLGCAEVVGIRPSAMLPPLPAALLTVVLVLTGAASAQAYFSRPVSQRYDAYRFDLVQLSDALRGDPGSSDIVLLDYYRATDIRFLNPGATVRFADPAHDHLVRSESPVGATACTLFALSRADLSRYADPAVAAKARPLAFDPQGRPSVWKARCG